MNICIGRNRTGMIKMDYAECNSWLISSKYVMSNWISSVNSIQEECYESYCPVQTSLKISIGGFCHYPWVVQRDWLCHGNWSENIKEYESTHQTKTVQASKNFWSFIVQSSDILFIFYWYVSFVIIMWLAMDSGIWLYLCSKMHKMISWVKYVMTVENVPNNDCRLNQPKNCVNNMVICHIRAASPTNSSIKVLPWN